MPRELPPKRDDWPPFPVIYQVYPRSFADTTGSGTGDLEGIRRGLGHIAGLGADAVWIGPVYPSPMVDGGYDVKEYCAVDPMFGGLDDIDRIIEEAGQLGLRVMMDLVFNHTSREHPWFRASERREDGKDDWYCWADPAPGGGAPNNWRSYFGPPAWTWHEGRRQYYLHTFLAEQPKLNLRHPELRAALKDVCRFWCDRGVKGFRMDAVTCYLHDPELKDNPPAAPEVKERMAGPPGSEYREQDHLHDFLPGDGVPFMREVRDWAGDDKYLLGEVNSGNKSVELSTMLVAEDRLDSAYVIDLAARGITGRVLADMVERGACDEGLAWWLSSHDQPRHVTRDGNGSERDARMFALLLLGLPGPLILYQGEELGQVQADLRRDQVTDPFDLRYWPNPPGRDAARVPLAWTAEAPGYGFTEGRPWLPMDTLGPPRSVDAQDGAGRSVLETYRTALGLRKARGMAEGSTEVLEAEEAWFVARINMPRGGEPTLVVLNLSHEDRAWHGLDDDGGRMLLASDGAEALGKVPRRSALWFGKGEGA
ncbi:alpha-amylase family glycosyl hydrolase [Histidinibacterium lentulum]|nr:alpha-amylase family glycosyl hydrolase [Histidinibacterium lentulum]